MNREEGVGQRSLKIENEFSAKSYGLGRDASKISIDMIDRYHSQQNLSDLEEFWVCSLSTSE